MSDNLILWELQKIHEVKTKTKKEHTLNFRFVKPTIRFYLSEPIINTTKLGLIRLSVYNSVFKVNRNNNQFSYASTVLEGDDDDGEKWAKPHALAEPLSSNTDSSTNTNSNSSASSNSRSVLNYNYKRIPLLHSNITPGAYELSEIAELIKEETNGNVIIEPGKNTVKC